MGILNKICPLHGNSHKMGIVKKRTPLPQCSPKVSFLIGLKQVKTFLLSFYVTLIHKNPKESNPKIGGLLRYRLIRVVKSI